MNIDLAITLAKANFQLSLAATLWVKCLIFLIELYLLYCTRNNKLLIDNKNMEKSKVDMFLATNNGMFKTTDLPLIKERLEKLDDEKFYLIQGLQLQKPDTIFLIAILLGWERFWLDDAGLGIVKLLTCFGCGIWWLIDIFSAKERAMKFNINQFNQVTSFM